MKKLRKLEVNPEKLMKNEDLLALRGGYGGVYFYLCISDFLGIIGCANTFTASEYVGLISCRACYSEPVDYVSGPYTPAGPDCCTSW